MRYMPTDDLISTQLESPLIEIRLGDLSPQSEQLAEILRTLNRV